MSVDGFSMGNIGLTTELSAGQMAGQAEHLAQKEVEIKVKDLDEAEKEEGVKRKKENEEGKNNQEFEDGFKKNDEEQNEDDGQSQIHTLTEDDIANKSHKMFSIRFNNQNEMVELFNSQTGETVEAMKADELMDVVLRLDNASGVLVNRKA